MTVRHNVNVLDIDIERYVLGELPEDRAKALEQILDLDAETRARVEAIKADNRAILEAYPPHLMAVQIGARAEEATAKRAAARRRVMIPAISAVIATTAAVLVVVILPYGPPSESMNSGHDVLEVTRIKGPTEPTLYVFRQGEKGEVALNEETAVSAGDVIQLKYAAKGQKYGIIFSVDGRGAVTLHYPASKGESAKIEPRGVHALQYSYELDDAPRFERFFFVTAEKPFDVSDVLEKGEALGASPAGKLALSSDLSVTDFLLKKK
jgi:hypothetical protein